MLRDSGYTISDGNVTETTSGYEKGHIKVIIKEIAPPDYDKATDSPISIKGQTATIEVLHDVIE